MTESFSAGARLSVIAGYELRELLGQGGFANTYRAEKGGEEFAVKLFHELPRGAEAERFEREVKALQLEHPNLVPYLESGIAPFGGRRLPYVVMPFIPGRTLRDAIEEAAEFDIAWICRVGSEVAEGLAFLHAHNIAHRDLTPKNVYVADDGRVLIIDFGLARFQDLSTLTLGGQIPGTLAYCAPEQIRGEVDLQIDIYGLGATLYHALTREPPFRSRKLGELIEMIRNEHPEPPSAKEASVPREVDDLVLSMLAKEPVQRPSSAEAVAEDLRRPRGDRRATPTPYDRDSAPLLVVRTTTRSAARAVLGAAVTGEVPDVAVAAVTVPDVLEEVRRAAGFDPRMRLAIDTRVELTAAMVRPKAIDTRGYAPEGGVPYRHQDLRSRDTSQRIAREDIREQDAQGGTLLRTACFPFSDPSDPWIRRDGRLIADQLHARDALNADAALWVAVRCDVDALASREDRLSIANRFSRGMPDGYWFETAGLSPTSAPEVINAAFDLYYLLQERGVASTACLPGPMVELAWSVGIAGVEVKLGRVGGWHGSSLRTPPRTDHRPRFEFPSIFASLPPEPAADLLAAEILPESDCDCGACRLTADPDARMAVAESHGLSCWLALRDELSSLSVTERVERLRERLEQAGELLVEVRKALTGSWGDSRQIRNLRATLDLLEGRGALGPMGTLRRRS